MFSHVFCLKKLNACVYGIEKGLSKVAPKNITWRSVN